MIYKTKAKSAFTLAEVLITLVIIGIVAALTIPTAISKYQKQQYVAGLKKAYSLLSQALYKIGQNKGYPVGDYSFVNNSNFVDEFAKVVSITKKCDTFTECFEKDRLNNENGYKSLSGGVLDSAIADGKSVITADGQMFSFKISGSLGNYRGISNDDIENYAGRIVVDLNGLKNPNQFGYDTFMFYIIKNKGIVPAGNYSTSDCRKTSYGWTCAARVLKENAINYW